VKGWNYDRLGSEHPMGHPLNPLHHDNPFNLGQKKNTNLMDLTFLY